MSVLSWNEIRRNAIHFGRDWQGAKSERAESQTFWNEFFKVFGLNRRILAAFEEPVKSIRNTYQRIDLFWRGHLIVEHKSAGESLDKASTQAFNYIQDLAAESRNAEIPRYVVVSDFQNFVLYDLEPDEEGQDVETHAFRLKDIHKHIRHFAFLIGQKTHRFGDEDPANLEAAQIMADLHDAVESSGYKQQHLERLLVRLLFCLFADDTGIFELGQFELYLLNRTKPDGSDLGAHLNNLFEVLNTAETERSTNLEEDLAAFPYVNGQLFADPLAFPSFNRDMRDRLIAASRFDWSRISPAIFGSLFQGIMEPLERRQVGGHYTSERDILKLIRPLFLDELRAEFKRIKTGRSTRRKTDLQAFQKKISSLKFLDPACGCGNFLVVAYRELRRLELDVIREIYGFASTPEKQWELGGEATKLSKVDVDQFYGIEIGEWPARIAETALWLTDHQMNTELSLATGNVFQRIPLQASPHILCANALKVDWRDLLPIENCSYVLGNPPFVGKKERNDEQREDHQRIWGAVKGAGILDYVTCWYVKAADYIGNRPIPVAFVSTNSISQGEQVGVLWGRLVSQYRLQINFAHTTFAWKSEARGPAHVHVVIVGFSVIDSGSKRLFVYETPQSEPVEVAASNINPYLADAPTVIIRNRSHPLSNVPSISYGSMMIDKDRSAGADEGLIFDDDERKKLIAGLPELKKYVKKIYGGEEFLNDTYRWCVWFNDGGSELIRRSARLKARVEKVRQFRLDSDRAATNKLAATPHLFGERRQPKSRYLLIPKVSSEQRTYIPIGFVSPDIIASGSALVMPDATPYEFGVVHSAMHMAWVRTVGGRLESRYQYSSNLIYNNFPWPQTPSGTDQQRVGEAAERLIEVRKRHLDGSRTLADLYDPLTMPHDLLVVHRAIDRAVDRCYRAGKFNSERERIQYLFALYEQLTAPLTTSPLSKRKIKRRELAR